MKQRAKSALIMAPLLIIVFLGGYFLIAGVIALTVLALREFSAAFGEKRPAAWVFFASLAVLYGGYLYLAIRWSMFDSSLKIMSVTPLMYLQLLTLWMFLSVVFCLLAMFAMDKRDLVNGMAAFVGVFYIILFAFYLVLIDNYYAKPFDAGFLRMSGLYNYVWIVFVSAFGTDIFAYFTGLAVGKHKLSPTISPKKTIEGSIGGVCGSVLLCVFFSLLFMPDELATCIVIGVAGGVFSQFGDLAASVIKRKIGIKDWGTLIPGHGGVLDRIDSILFTAPLVFYILALRDYLSVYSLI